MKLLIALVSMIVVMVSAGEVSTFVPEKITSVYDGDTFTVDLKCTTNVFCKGLPIRVHGVDTPEKRGSSSHEKILSNLARNVTIDFLENSKNLVLENCIRGKYFRLVCVVKSERGTLSDILIEQRLGVPYFGNTKVTDWDTWKR